MADPADLEIVQGVPLSRSYRFVAAVDLWPGAAGCEARAQIRKQATSTEVLYDLTPHLSVPAVVADGDGAGTDIVVVLTLTGQDTRGLPAGPGVYDLFLSDVGIIDARAIRVANADGNPAQVVVKRAGPPDFRVPPYVSNRLTPAGTSDRHGPSVPG